MRPKLMGVSAARASTSRGGTDLSMVVSDDYERSELRTSFLEAEGWQTSMHWRRPVYDCFEEVNVRAPAPYNVLQPANAM